MDLGQAGLVDPLVTAQVFDRPAVGESLGQGDLQQRRSHAGILTRRTGVTCSAC
jgi:hypothetical protein